MRIDFARSELLERMVSLLQVCFDLTEVLFLDTWSKSASLFLGPRRVRGGSDSSALCT